MYQIEVLQDYQYGEYEHESSSKVIGIYENKENAKIAVKRFIKEKYGIIDKEFEKTKGKGDKICFYRHSNEIDEDVSTFIFITEIPINKLYGTDNIF